MTAKKGTKATAKKRVELPHIKTTFRIVEQHELQAIQDLQTYFKTGVTTKAVMKAAMRYLPLLKDMQQQGEELYRLREEFVEMEKQIKQFKNSLNWLNSIQ